MTDAMILLRAIAGQATTGHVEIRHPNPRGSWMKTFFAITDLQTAERYALGVGGYLDVYVGTAPRSRRGGKREDVGPAWLLSADCDDDASIDALRRFRPAPTIVIRSGSLTASGDHKLHAHWALRAPIDAATLQAAKQRLAAALGSDSSIVDPNRIMRLPGTGNFKGTPRPVTLRHHDPAAVYTVAKVVGDVHRLPLRDVSRPPRPIVPAADTGVIIGDGDALLEIPAAVYVPALTGRHPDRYGYLRCPLPGHDDRTPSFRVYGQDDAGRSRGWFCFGRECARGGSIYDLAGYLTGHPQRPGRARADLTDRDRLRLRDVLTRIMLDHHAAAAAAPAPRRAAA